MRVLTLCILLGFLLGCAGAPPQSAQPDWMRNEPATDAEYQYFVASGTSKEGDQAKAEETARGAVIDRIMQYVGVEVTSESVATAKGSVDELKSEFNQTLKTAGSGRISGLEVKERYLDKGSQGLTVWVLARYNKVDLERTKKEIQEQIENAKNAIAKPEKEGRQLDAEGRSFEAAARFMNAATAAAKSGIKDARIDLKRNIDNAKNSLEAISLVKLNDNLETPAGKEFSEPFRLKVVQGAKAADPGVPGVTVTVSYVEVKADRKTTRTAQVKTGDDGVASFSHPVPDFVGQEKVTMAVALGSYMEALRDATLKIKDMAALVDGLDEVLAKKKAVFSYRTVSMAKEIETGMVVAVADEEGKAVAGREFSSGVSKSLGDARFRIKSLTVKGEDVMDGGSLKSDSEVIALAASGAASTTGRVIFGLAKVTGTEKEGTDFIVKVSGSLKVADLKTGEILLTVNRGKSMVGKSAAAALSSALQKVGEELGQDIANKLK